MKITRISLMGIFLCANSVMSVNVHSHDADKTNKKFNNKQLEVLNDLPLKSDLEDYVTRLEKLIQFVDKNKVYTDINLYFGLYLIDVNLRTIVKFKEPRVPNNIIHHLKQILKTYDAIKRYFLLQVEKHKKESDLEEVTYILDLFAEDQLFANHLKIFTPNLLWNTTFYSKQELVGIYSKWPEYVKNYNYNMENMIPSPEQSDKCLSLLSAFEVNRNRWLKPCRVTHSCSDKVLNGSGFGYALSHRFLYLLFARFSRGCYLLSASEDKYHANKMCAMMYNEMEHHAHNNFVLPDLPLEIIALCTLEGHVQFLRRSWLAYLLSYQDEIGCFRDNVKEVSTESRSKPEWTIINGGGQILGGQCDSHTTGVAAAAISAAIRYILETFY